MKGYSCHLISLIGCQVIFYLARIGINYRRCFNKFECHDHVRTNFASRTQCGAGELPIYAALQRVDQDMRELCTIVVVKLKLTLDVKLTFNADALD
jgi:hypothetical protein